MSFIELNVLSASLQRKRPRAQKPMRPFNHTNFGSYGYKFLRRWCSPQGYITLLTRYLYLSVVALQFWSVEMLLCRIGGLTSPCYSFLSDFWSLGKASSMGQWVYTGFIVQHLMANFRSVWEQNHPTSTVLMICQSLSSDFLWQCRFSLVFAFVVGLLGMHIVLTFL